MNLTSACRSPWLSVAAVAMALGMAACGGEATADGPTETAAASGTPGTSGTPSSSGISGFTGPDACSRVGLNTAGPFVMAVGAGRFDHVEKMLADDDRFDALTTPLQKEPVTKRGDVVRALEAVRASDATLTGPRDGVMSGSNEPPWGDPNRTVAWKVTYDSDGEVVVHVACDIERIVRVEWQTLSR